MYSWCLLEIVVPEQKRPIITSQSCHNGTIEKDVTGLRVICNHIVSPKAENALTSLIFVVADRIGLRNEGTGFRMLCHDKASSLLHCEDGNAGSLDTG